MSFNTSSTPTVPEYTTPEYHTPTSQEEVYESLEAALRGGKAPCLVAFELVSEWTEDFSEERLLGVRVFV